MSGTRSRRAAVRKTFPAVEALGALTTRRYGDACLLEACEKLQQYRDRCDAAMQMKGAAGRAARKGFDHTVGDKLEWEVATMPAQTAAGRLAKVEAALRGIPGSGTFFKLPRAVLLEYLFGLQMHAPLDEVAEADAELLRLLAEAERIDRAGQLAYDHQPNPEVDRAGWQASVHRQEKLRQEANKLRLAAAVLPGRTPAGRIAKAEALRGWMEECGAAEPNSGAKGQERLALSLAYDVLRASEL